MGTLHRLDQSLDEEALARRLSALRYEVETRAKARARLRQPEERPRGFWLYWHWVLGRQVEAMKPNTSPSTASPRCRRPVWCVCSSG